MEQTGKVGEGISSPTLGTDVTPQYGARMPLPYKSSIMQVV